MVKSLIGCSLYDDQNMARTWLMPLVLNIRRGLKYVTKVGPRPCITTVLAVDMVIDLSYSCDAIISLEATLFRYML